MSFRIISPRATSSLGDGLRGATVTAVLDNWAVAEGIYDDGPKGVIALSSAEQLQEFSEQLQAARSNNSTPSDRISLSDGEGGTIEFEGYRGSLFTATGVREFSRSTVITHKASGLSGLNFSVFPLYKSEFAQTTNLLTGTITERFMGVVQAILKEGEQNFETYAHPLSQNMRATAENTRQLLPMLEELMQNSADSIGWESVADLQAVQGLSQRINQYLVEVIKANMGDFMNNIREFARAFNAWYSPDMGPTVGRLVGIGALDRAAVTIDVDHVRLTGATSPPMLYVPSGVVVDGLPHMPVPAPDKIKTDENVVALLVAGNVVHPPEAKGILRNVPAPPWMTKPAIMETNEATGETAEVRFATTGADSQEQQNARFEQHLKIIEPMAREFAKNALQEFQTSGASVNISMPLKADPNMRPGYPARINFANGGSLTGVIQQVQHRVSGDQNGPTAETSLTLTNLQ